MLKIWGKKRINRYAIMIAESNFSFVELFIPSLSLSLSSNLFPQIKLGNRSNKRKSTSDHLFFLRVPPKDLPI